jgi:hypothetical protein
MKAMKYVSITCALGVVLAIGMGQSPAASAAPDWNGIGGTDVTLFYPGVSSMDWTVGRRHGGGRAFMRGDTCMECHGGEAADMGNLIVSGEKLEPTPIPGKVGAIPVHVQAAHDGETLYLRFSWRQPPASGHTMNTEHRAKLAFMLDADKVELADRSGCWASCHGDSRTMPDASESRFKYVPNGSLANGVFYDLKQWRSGDDSAHSGYVADTRVLEPAGAVLETRGEQAGDVWTVVFARRFQGGESDLPLQSGQRYNFGFALHDDYTIGRFHHVSLNYTLGIDADADVKAVRF